MRGWSLLAEDSERDRQPIAKAESLSRGRSTMPCPAPLASVGPPIRLGLAVPPVPAGFHSAVQVLKACTAGVSSYTWTDSTPAALVAWTHKKFLEPA